MSQIEALAEAILAGCGANVGPMIGTELETSEATVETTSDPPSGDLAVLPIICEVDGEELATLFLATPLSEIVTFARLMLGVEEEAKEGEFTEEDLGAIGETLNLMSGAVDQVVRDQLNANIRSRPGQWWRSNEPGENTFAEGEHHLVSGSVSAPDSNPVHLFLRVPPALLELVSSVTSAASTGAALLLGLDEELGNFLNSTLTQAGMEVRSLNATEEQNEATYENVEIVVLLGDEKGLRACRDLRGQPSSWALSSLVCLEEPTKEAVIKAIQAGASHVLRVPTEATELLRVIHRLGDSA